MKESSAPALWSAYRDGTLRGSWSKDLLAGIIVGVLAFPLALAFAIASGLPPETGWVTAVVAGGLISLGSGSRFQIGGPTGAFVLLVHQTVTQYGHEGLIVATALAGLILLAMGAMKLGGVIRYIPYPVTVGFTSAIALIIATGQIPELMGWSGPWPEHLHERWIAYAQHLGLTNFASLALGAATILIVTQFPRLSRRVPGSLVAILLTTLLAVLLGLDVPTIGSRFPTLDLKLPTPGLPALDWHLIQALLPSAVAIALLGGLESLLSAMVADGMTGQRHRPNTELVGQGIANVAVSFVGGMPATGAIARTAANIKNGGVTPLSGIVHALTLLVLGLALGRYLQYVPMATLAGILLVVAYHMSEWRLFVRLFRSPREDVGVLLITFLLTVFVDLTYAIPAGVVLAALLFMRRMANATPLESLDHADLPRPELAGHEIQTFRLRGPFFFGVADTCLNTLDRVDRRYRALILDFADVPWMDATGLRALESLVRKAERAGKTVYLVGLRDQPHSLIAASPILADRRTHEVTTLEQALADFRAQ
ncbi:MAG: SulP family inorganic anion transporter [Verrucomicrobiota bacterium JB022]|nr:SulP family inorganic anion transporter [Verrucomicrobiota bacterium JB022]